MVKQSAASHTDTLSNSLEYNFATTKNLVLRAIKKKRPVFIWGPPGIGKSEMIEEIGNDFNKIGKRTLVIDLRAALMDPTDFRGVGYYNPKENNMLWAAPVDLPSAELAAQYDIVVLFLDELVSAPPATQGAAYSLILNRRIGTYNLPDNVVIVAAGNRENDRGVTYKMPKPLQNRFVHYTLRATMEDWFPWAINAHIHADVISYLSYFKGDLFKFDPRSADNAFPSPRSWKFVSDLIEDTDSEEFTTAQVAGAVGLATASTFMTHRKTVSHMPKSIDILTGKVKEMPKNANSGAVYAVAINTSRELQEFFVSNNIENKPNSAQGKEFKNYVNNFFQFVTSQFEIEMQIMTIRLITLVMNMQIDMDVLTPWIEKHRNIFASISSSVEKS